MNWDYLGEVNSNKAIRNNKTRTFDVTCELSNPEISRHAPNTLRAIHGKCLLVGETPPTG